LVEQGALPQEEPLRGSGQRVGALWHEGGGRRGRDAGDLGPPRGQFHDRENIIRDATVPWSDFHGQAVRGCEHFPMR
jgi:hypothetical protein